MSFFHNFWKVPNRTNSEFSVNSECSETPDSELFPNFLTQKQVFFDPKTGNYFWTYFWTIFAKFLRFQKDRIFQKNFRTSKTELFWNLWKWKVLKILSNAGPWLSCKKHHNSIFFVCILKNDSSGEDTLHY
jgi:hypothetical protein